VRRIAPALGLVLLGLLISPAPEAMANPMPYYWLPWTAGESRLVTQGNNGPYPAGGLTRSAEGGGKMTARVKGG